MAVNELVVHIFTSAANGGMEHYVAAMIGEQYRAGYQVLVGAIPRSPAWNVLENNNVKLFSLSVGKYFSLVNIMRVRNILHDEKAAVVHIHTGKDVWLGAEACFGTRSALVYSTYMNVAPKHDLLHRVMYRRIDAFGSSSEQINCDIIRHFDARPESVFSLKYGRNLPSDEELRKLRAEGRRRLDIADDEIFVLSLSRIDKQKGIEEFVRAMRILDLHNVPDIRFGIVGSPTQSNVSFDGTPIYEKDAVALQSWLQSFLRENNLENKCTLLPNQSEYMSILAAADIFVLASYGEMYSLAVIEAMSCGVAIIGTDIGGTIEQIGKDSAGRGLRGILITPRNADALAEAITSFTAQPELRKLCGEAAKDWARTNHTFKAALAQVDTAYNFAINSRRAK